MIDILLGMVGMLLGIAIFYAGYRMGLESRAPTKVVAQELVEPDEAEAAELEAARERLRQDQAAFHDLLGYNADVAYGVKAMPHKE
jgi:hypothetical protein